MRVEAAIMIYNRSVNFPRVCNIGDDLKVTSSPYAEVRAVVDNHDDPTIPASTVRTWIIGLVFVGAGAFINQFFSIRYPGICEFVLLLSWFR